MDTQINKIVICKHCNKPEYWEKMRWLNGFYGCRSCYKQMWQDENHKIYIWDDLNGERPTMHDYLNSTVNL